MTPPKRIFEEENPQEVEGTIIRRLRSLTIRNLSYREAFRLVIRDTLAVVFFVLLLFGLYRIYRMVFVRETSPREELRAYFREDLKRVWEEGFKTFVAGAVLVLARKGVIKFLERASVVKIVFLVELVYRVVVYGYKLLKGEIGWRDFWKKLFEDSVIVIGGLTGTFYGAVLGAFVYKYLHLLSLLFWAFVGGFVGGILGEAFARLVVKLTEYFLLKVAHLKKNH